jgi:hypothetical protein
MCILVADVGTLGNYAHVVEPVLLPIEASLLVSVPTSLATYPGHHYIDGL